MDQTGLGFPFGINALGGMRTLEGDENIRAGIMQVLLTSPGERVHAPEFGCGLRDLVFDPGNEILAAATEFNVAKALQRWMGDRIMVQRVGIEGREAELSVEVDYIRRDRLEQGKIKIAF